MLPSHEPLLQLFSTQRGYSWDFQAEAANNTISEPRTKKKRNLQVRVAVDMTVSPIALPVKMAGTAVLPHTQLCFTPVQVEKAEWASNAVLLHQMRNKLAKTVAKQQTEDE